VIYEYFDVQDLSQYLADVGGFVGIEEARRVIVEVVKGLDYLHSLGITYGEIKPQNIFLLQRGEVVRLKMMGYEKMVLKGLEKMEKKIKLSEFITTPYFNDKLDVWTVGKLLLLLIGGEIETSDNLVIRTKAKLSLEALNFLSGCLQYSYMNRMNWKELMNHPFINAGLEPIQKDDRYAYCLLKPHSLKKKELEILRVENSRLKTELINVTEEAKKLKKELEDDKDRKDLTKNHRKAYASLKEWIVRSGGQVVALEPASLTEGVRKVITRKNVSMNQRILFIPDNILFTLEKATASCELIRRVQRARLRHPTNSKLSIWCLEERAKLDTPYKVFFDTFLDIPRSYPLFYNEAEMRLLIGSSMKGNPSKYRSYA
jgi:serine/threonine protein kinase